MRRRPRNFPERLVDEAGEPDGRPGHTIIPNIDNVVFHLRDELRIERGSLGVRMAPGAQLDT
jgi:hypothetical protein